MNWTPAQRPPGDDWEPLFRSTGQADRQVAPFDNPHVPSREVLDHLLPANDGPGRPKAPARAVDQVAPLLEAQRTPTAPNLAERHAHRLLFARWLHERSLHGEWSADDA